MYLVLNHDTVFSRHHKPKLAVDMWERLKNTSNNTPCHYVVARVLEGFHPIGSKPLSYCIEPILGIVKQ